MSNEIIIDMLLLIPIVTIAMIPLIFYLLCLCQGRLERLSIPRSYTRHVFSSTMVGCDGLIIPAVTYKKNWLNPEAVSTISLNVPDLDPAFSAYMPTEMLAKVWKADSEQVNLYCYRTFVMVDENHI